MALLSICLPLGCHRLRCSRCCCSSRSDHLRWVCRSPRSPRSRRPPRPGGSPQWSRCPRGRACCPGGESCSPRRPGQLPLRVRRD